MFQASLVGKKKHHWEHSGTTPERLPCAGACLGEGISSGCYWTSELGRKHFRCDPSARLCWTCSIRRDLISLGLDLFVRLVTLVTGSVNWDCLFVSLLFFWRWCEFKILGLDPFNLASGGYFHLFTVENDSQFISELLLEHDFSVTGKLRGL